MIRSLIWDAGGTLFNTYPAAVMAFRRALHERGLSVPQTRILELCKHSLRHCTTTLARDFELDRSVLYTSFKEYYAQIPLSAQYPFPGVVDVCALVCEHGGDNFVVTHRCRASLMALMAEYQMAHYFSDFITSDDGYPRKPDPASIQALLQRHALVLDATLAIGDRDIDIRAAMRAGVHTCFFGEVPSNVQPDLTITDFQDLKRMLLDVWVEK